jgi:uncharacterized phiE125 gp8 family phage protein
MTTTLVTAPVSRPLSIGYVKKHLIINDDNDDVLIELLLDSATAQVEGITNRKLITQTWKYFLSEWPDGEYIALPFGELQSVTHVKYKDTAGTQTTWSAAEYIVDTDSEPGRVVLDYGETWPGDDLYPSNPIEIQFVCGYGAVADVSAPAPLLHAIMLLVANGYENRQTYLNGTAMVATEVPGYLIGLLGDYRLGWFN